MDRDTSRDWASAASLNNLWQCLTILTVTLIFLTEKWRMVPIPLPHSLWSFFLLCQEVLIWDVSGPLFLSGVSGGFSLKFPLLFLLKYCSHAFCIWTLHLQSLSLWYVTEIITSQCAKGWSLNCKDIYFCWMYFRLVMDGISHSGTHWTSFGHHCLLIASAVWGVYVSSLGRALWAGVRICGDSLQWVAGKGCGKLWRGERPWEEHLKLGLSPPGHLGTRGTCPGSPLS